MSIPKDGYYTAWVQLDTGGTLPAYVRVKDGVIRDSDGDELRLDACSKFNPVSAQQFCGVWPREAAMELEALRTANAGLVERVKRLEEAAATAVETLEMAKQNIEHEIRVMECMGRATNQWPDVLTGCVSGGGINAAITKIKEAKGQP